MNLTIKNIPPKVHAGLKKEAARRGRSLNARILEVLADDVALAERRRYIREHREELELFLSKLPRMPSSVPLIRADRNSH